MKNRPRGDSSLELAADCEDVVRLVWPFLDDELTLRDAARVRQHLRECASCRAFVRFERAFLRAMHAALRPPRQPSSRGLH